MVIKNVHTNINQLKKRIQVQTSKFWNKAFAATANQMNKHNQQALPV